MPRPVPAAYRKPRKGEFRQPSAASSARAGDLKVLSARWVFRFESQDGTVTEMVELAYQRWQGEQIAQEQFFYDPAQRVPKRP
jgi:hypothetical protein